MNVASLSLCKELYELSGWDTNDLAWAENPDRIVHLPVFIETTPAYSLGYLLRKLQETGGSYYQGPIQIIMSALKQKDTVTNGNLYTEYAFKFRKFQEKMSDEFPTEFRAKTPEDALCKLAIELWKQGVLK